MQQEQSTNLDLLTPQQLRDQGIKAAVDHAIRENSEWSDVAMEILKAYLEFYGGEFCCNDVIKYSERFDLLPPPPDRRAWGGIVLNAAKLKLIKKNGYMYSPDRRHHCGIVTAWVKA